MRHAAPLHGTTILAVRQGGTIALAGDGQVTLGQTVVKHHAEKIQRRHKICIHTNDAIEVETLEPLVKSQDLSRFIL